MTTKKYMTLSVVILAIFALVASASAVVSVGSKASDFQLTSVDGKSAIKLSSYFGKPMLLVYWASWCPHCRTEVPVVQKIYNDLHSAGLEIVGVSFDRSAKDARDFMKSKSVTFPVAFGGTDQGMKVADIYGVSGIPVTFVLDKNAVVKTVFRGDPGEKAIRAELTKLGLSK
ncbi:MAG: TlpA disulfide reductase family protein [Armatimonadota bacterium]